MMLFDVERLETKRTIFRAVEANTSEEAVVIVEAMAEDGDQGEVIEVTELEMDAYPTEELPVVE